MTQDTFRVGAAEMPVSVLAVLRPGTGLQMDPAPLGDIYRNLGPEAAERAVCRTLEDVALRLSRLFDLKAANALCSIGEVARRTARVAEQIGLIEVARAARHVGVTADQGDGVALEATLARLERAYDMALAEIWDFQSL